MLEGSIQVGDILEWCPYGHPGWPACHAMLRVTAIKEGRKPTDEELVEVETEHLEYHHRVWNTMAHVREMCVRGKQRRLDGAVKEA